MGQQRVGFEHLAEAEDGKIEAICTDAATAKKMDVSIDPATGAVLTIKDSND